MNAEQFGMRVRTQRLQEGLSQDELADKIGISRNYLSQIERGQATNISYQYLQRLVLTLGIELPQEGVTSSTDLLPPGLQEFADRAQIPSADLHMLAKLNYRGKQPDTADKWEMLYRVIKSVLE